MLSLGAGDADLLDFIRRLAAGPPCRTTRRGMPCKFKVSSIISRVVPGTAVTMARLVRKKRVQQRRFADIGTACENDVQTLADQNAAGRRSPASHRFDGSRPQVRHRSRPYPGRRLLPGKSIVASIWARTPRTALGCPDGAAETAFALPPGQSVRLRGLSGDQVPDRFCLREVHLAVQKGPLGEFAGPGQPCAAFQQTREDLA